MRALVYRAFLTCINIFFPPLAVAMLCGMEWDCMLNCCFFLLAVIPSHVHGFYISCTYFHRRGKVKKGRYPGGSKSMIHSRNVLNGGASNAEVDRLWRKENGLERKSSGRTGDDGLRRNGSRRTEKQSSNMQRQNSQQRGEMMQRQNSQLERTGTNRRRPSVQSQRPGMNSTRTEQHTARDGYGLPKRTPSSRPGPSAQTMSYSPLSPQLSQSSRRFQGF
ncbi:hypothetical protein LTR85_005483 [Meristemomyces frigidus]|nr:hypothetical protein LTR85_005483 [Meristemomyces frigidus]